MAVDVALPAPPLSEEMAKLFSRDSILSRYRRWSALRKEAQSSALKNVSTTALLTYAKRIGLADGRDLIVKYEEEMTLIYDLAVYGGRPGRTRAIDRYTKGRAKRADAEERLVLESLRESFFSIFRVLEQPLPAGLLVEDLMRGGRYWLLDEGLEECTGANARLAMRVAPIEHFIITSGAAIPLEDRAEDIDVFLGEAEKEALALVADDGRFVELVYRIAVEEDLMAVVRYR